MVGEAGHLITASPHATRHTPRAQIVNPSQIMQRHSSLAAQTAVRGIAVSNVASRPACRAANARR